MKNLLFLFVVLLLSFTVAAEPPAKNPAEPPAKNPAEPPAKNPAGPSAKITAELEEVFNEYVKYCNTENIAGIMNIIHSKSAIYPSVRIEMSRVAAGYDLKYELMSFKFVGISGEYAIVRTVQKTTKLKGGPDYRNNILEALQVFKKEDGKWKIWTTAILSMRYFK